MNNPTDTNQASELFELCKEVYRRTKWQQKGTAIILRMIFNDADDGAGLYKHLEGYLYTSDYLLEKLQAIPTKEPEIQDEPHIIVEHSGVVKPEYKWSAKAFNGDWLEVKSTTPLKALLKLVIALSKAGVKL